VTVEALFNVFFTEEFCFALGTNVLCAIAFIFLALDFFGLGVHTHELNSFASNGLVIG
jgi:hypothetical protein